ncbi:MAG: sigma-70 family RNA polymerase sigma factor [Firmicutes bacterium]|nr:sigma-70 family RNA polymerase sigma factor [Bacillota bacterium]
MLREYLAELSKIELLRPEEEENLWQAFKEEGCRKSRQRLIEAYQPLVLKIALQMARDEALCAELVQEGTVGLIEAVETFMPGRAVKFATFARHRIRGRMLDFLRRTARGPHPIPVADLRREEVEEFPTPSRAGFVDFEAVLGREALRVFLGQALARLSPRERQVLEGIYLEDRSPQELAALLGISPSYLYKTQKKALRRLRGLLAKNKAEIKALG